MRAVGGRKTGKRLIRTKLVIINIALLANMLMLVLVMYASTTSLIRQVAVSTDRSFLSSENYISNYMYNYKMIATNLAQSASTQAFLLEENTAEKVLQADEIKEMIKAMKVVRTEISSISLIRKDGTMIGTEGYIWKLSRDGAFQELWEGFSDLHRLPRGTSRQFYSLPVFDTYFPKGAESIGNVVISFDTQIYTDLFGTATSTDGDLFFIVDRNGNIAQTNSKERQAQLTYSAQRNILLQRDVCTINGELYLLFEKEIAVSGWKMVYFSSLGKILSQAFSELLAPMLLTLLLEFVALSFSMHIFARIRSSLGKIVAFSGNIFLSDGESRLHFSRKDEFSVIGDSINCLLDSSQEMSREMLAAHQSLYEAELARKNMEMDFLQNQINPHFLYNTLACMKSIAEIRGVPEISSLAFSMSNTYRYGLKAQPVVSLEEELAFVREYFSIIAIRFMNRFSLQIDCPKALLSAKIFRMLLQPFVENSVLHGLERKRGAGTVTICARREADRLFLEISDDGCGMTGERLQELRDSLCAGGTSAQKSIGLINVYRRIKNAYGDDYGFEIESVHGAGCRVVITIPYSGAE